MHSKPDGMMYKSLVYFFIITFLPVLGLSETYLIPDDYPTIQAGVDAADDGDTVLVAPGTYRENILFPIKSICLISAEGPKVTFLRQATADSSIVSFYNDANDTAQMIGFTIAESSPLFLIDIGGVGGAGHTVISNNIFKYNNPEHCIISVWGNGKAIIKNNLLISNQGDFCLWLLSKYSTVVNNTFVYNRGAIAVRSNSSIIRNNIIANSSGYGIHNASFVLPACDFNNVIGNNPDYTNDAHVGAHNISEQPIFVDPLHQEYNLMPGSPGINAGDPDSPVPMFGGLRIDMGAFEFTSIECGDVNVDGAVDLGDAIALINIVFKNSRLPAPTQMADLNGDSHVNVGDAVFIIKYLYHGGPSPENGCSSNY